MPMLQSLRFESSLEFTTTFSSTLLWEHFMTMFHTMRFESSRNVYPNVFFCLPGKADCEALRSKVWILMVVDPAVLSFFWTHVTWAISYCGPSQVKLYKLQSPLLSSGRLSCLILYLIRTANGFLNTLDLECQICQRKKKLQSLLE